MLIVWNQNGKCIKMSTNMPIFGPVVHKTTCIFFIFIFLIMESFLHFKYLVGLYKSDQVDKHTLHVKD